MTDLKTQLLSLSLVVENEYLDLYCDLIEANKQTKRIKTLTQKHHIIPRSYFKEQGIAVNNKPENLVNLFHKDHILAHYYLYKCSAIDYFTYSNEYALLYMLRIHKLPEETDQLLQQAINYGEVYSDFCLRQSARYKGKERKECRGHHPSEATRQKQSLAHLGHQQSEQTRKKRGDSLRQAYAEGRRKREKSSSQKQKISQTTRGRKVIHKGDQVLRVSTLELSHYLQEGWTLGQSETQKPYRQEQLKRLAAEGKLNKKTSTRQSQSLAAKNRLSIALQGPQGDVIRTKSLEYIKNLYSQGYVYIYKKRKHTLEDTLNVLEDRVRIRREAANKGS